MTTLDIVICALHLLTTLVRFIRVNVSNSCKKKKAVLMMFGFPKFGITKVLELLSLESPFLILKFQFLISHKHLSNL